MNNGSPERTYFPALDGLRGIAILLVVLYHNFGFISYFNFGWLGVDLFFVLSGFLITDILRHTKDTRHYFRNFYARRVLRIFPVYYLSLLLFLVLLPLFPFYPLNVEYYQKHQLWFWIYLQNWTLIFSYGGTEDALNHFWSLAVEEQFYVVWPFVVMFIRNPKRLIGVCLVALLAVIAARLFIWEHREQYPYYQWLFFFTRIDGILIGSILALIYRSNQTILTKYSAYMIILLLGINYIIFYIHNHYSFPIWAMIGYATFSALFALVVYECISMRHRAIGFIINNPVFRFLGKYSYGLYIFHWPIFLLTKPYTDAWMGRLLNPDGLSFRLCSALLATIAGIVVSVASFHLFEKRFLQLKKHFA